MPFPNQQSAMATFLGSAPGLDVYQRIPNIQSTANLVALTANYTMLPTDSGNIFTTLGATGAVTLTLPAVASSAGMWCEFFNAVDQSCAVSAPSGTMVYDGNAGITTLTWGTGSHKIGGAARFYCDGTKWYAFVAANGSAAPTAS
jgi:hypothetical protein